MKKYSVKRKMAAALCAVLLSTTTTSAALGEAVRIMRGEDELSRQLMENSQNAQVQPDVQAVQAEAPKAEIAQIEAKFEKAPDAVIEKIEKKEIPLIEAVVPEKKETPLVEAIVPVQTVPENVQQADPPKAETEQKESQIEQAPDALTPAEDQNQQQNQQLEQVQKPQQVQQVQQLQAQPLKQAPLSLKTAPVQVTEAYDDAEVTGVTKVSAEGEKDGAIEGKVTFTSDRKVVVKLYTAAGEYVTDVKLDHGSGSEVTKAFSFADLAAGEYEIEVWFEGDGYAGKSAQETISGVKVEVKQPDPPAVPEGDVTAGSASGVNCTSAASKDGQITGSITFTGTRNGVVLIYNASGEEIKAIGVSANADGAEKTGGFTADGLPMGEYTVKFYLQGDVQQNIHPEARITKHVIIQPKELPKINLSVSESGGKITATVSGALERDVDVWVSKVTYDEAGDIDSEEKVTTKILWGNGAAELGTFANGYYKVYADYASPTFDNNGNSTTRAVSGVIKIEGGGTTTVVPAEPTILELTGSVSKTKDSITVTVNADDDFKVVIMLTDAAGNEEMVEIEPGKPLTHTFTGLAEGSYEIYADYYEAYGASPYEATVTLSSAATQIAAKAEGGNNRIDVTITAGDDEDISVKLMKGGGEVTAKTIAAGGRSAAFESLAAGTYSVVVDYATPKTGSSAVTIDEIPVTNARASIAIGDVTGGENILTVTGTAQPGSQVVVYTKPAVKTAAIPTVGADGKFTAVIAADPQTYTEVYAYYIGDDSSTAVKKTGSWTVKAAATEPTITVDPIDNYSTTVVVKTGANLLVTLKTPDSTLTARSDANGLAYFSLTHKYLEGEAFTVTVAYGDGDSKSVSKTVKVVTASDFKDLEYGDYGEAVLRLTTRLNALGYPVPATKDYNKTVREAVRLFQLANGLTADGEAGDRTQAALFSVSAIPYNASRYPTLVRGDKGLSLIYTLQQRLKDLGYYTIKVDGIFGSGTQRAVRLFQSVNGLPETGVADNATQVLLYSSAAKPLGYGTTGEYKTLQRSSKYKSAVVPLQRRLKALGYYSGSIDGYFGSKTYRAVRNFQSRNSLKVTGIADPLTQQVLYSSGAKKYNGSTASSSSSSTSTGYRLLYWGCRGEAVTRLQSALIDAGYKSYVRKADGIFGQWTYDAVRAYQKDHGLTVDGIAGKNTQNSLYGTNY